MAIRKKPYKCFLVEEDGLMRRIPMGLYHATTPTFAQRQTERRHATWMKSLECGKYHIEASQQPEAA